MVLVFALPDSVAKTAVRNVLKIRTARIARKNVPVKMVPIVLRKMVDAIVPQDGLVSYVIVLAMTNSLVWIVKINASAKIMRPAIRRMAPVPVLLGSLVYIVKPDVIKDSSDIIARRSAIVIPTIVLTVIQQLVVVSASLNGEE